MELNRVIIDVIIGIIVGLAVFFITYLIMKPVTLQKQLNSLDSRLSKLEGNFEVFIQLQDDFKLLQKKVTNVEKDIEEIKPLVIVEKTLLLEQAPITWGRPIRGSSGRIIYYDNSKGTFSGKIELQGLIPNSNYVLSLNGKPAHFSNDLLPERYGNEGKFDFLQVTTNSIGNVDETFNATLPSGDYNVKFFVKDKKDWKIVLYNDYLFFKVK